MNTRSFDAKRNEYRVAIDESLEQYLEAEMILPLMREAMRYSLLSGGKRLRPMLLLAAGEMCGGDREELLPLASGLEMIHTYSLIHDDLPAIDNDTKRRGRATNHVVFGEANAILTGDALLNYAYEVMLEGAKAAKTQHPYVDAISCIAELSGPRALIAGQMADLAHEGDVAAGIDQLNFIHDNKTGALFRAAALGGGIASQASSQQLEALDTYSTKLGLAFQIADDILDVKGGEKLGKTAGKDAAAGKLTFVRMYGLERAVELGQETSQEAIDALADFGDRADFLRQLANLVVDRDH